MNSLHITLLVGMYGLILTNATVNYTALPIYIVKHSNPDSNKPRIRRMGIVMIAISVGINSCASLVLNNNGSFEAYTLWAGLAVLLMLDIYCGLMTILKGI